MRQILIGACVVFSCTAIAACNGAEFSQGSSASDDDSASGAKQTSGSAGRTSAGTSSSSGGANQGSGGKATGGSTTTLPPAAGSPGTAGSGTSTGGSGMGGGEECAEGSVTIKMLPGPDLPHDYLCDAGCGTGWLTITDAEGASAFTLFSACGTASCESCEILPCAAAACLPTPLGSEGNTLTWTGTYLAQDKCGQDMACQRQTCVPPGRYRAKACAAVNAGQSGMGGGCVPKDGIMLCSEAEFDFPSSSELELVLQHQ